MPKTIRLTENSMRTLVAGEWSDSLSPLEARIRESGVHTFFVRYYEGPDGARRRVRKAIGRWWDEKNVIRVRRSPTPRMSVDAARQLAREKVTEATEGGLSSEVATTFEGLVERWQRRAVHHLKPRSIEFYDSKLRTWILPSFANVPARQVSKRDITLLVDDIISDPERPRISVANGVIRTISAIYSFGVKAGYVETNPAKGIPLAGTDRERTRFLNDNEIGVLWHLLEADDWQSTRALRLALLTGQRRGEVMGMRWSEVSFQDALWSIPPERRKRGKRHHYVPLAGPAMSLIRGQGGLHEEFVFPNKAQTGPQETARYTLKKLVERAGIPHVRIHDLRRSCSEGMRRLGASPWVQAAVLGHAVGPQVTLKNYTSDNPAVAAPKQALETWANHVLACARRPR